MSSAVMMLGNIVWTNFLMQIVFSYYSESFHATSHFPGDDDL